MTKLELLQKCWIPIDKRLPPDEIDGEDHRIIVWDPKLGQVSTVARIFNIQQRQIKKKQQSADNTIAGYRATHWMKLPSPKE